MEHKYDFKNTNQVMRFFGGQKSDIAMAWGSAMTWKWIFAVYILGDQQMVV